MAAGANDNLNVKNENRPTKSRSTSNEDLIAREVKSAVKGLSQANCTLRSKSRWATYYASHCSKRKAAFDYSFVRLSSWGCWTCYAKKPPEIRVTLIQQSSLIPMQPPTGCQMGCWPQAHLGPIVELLNRKTDIQKEQKYRTAFATEDQIRTMETCNGVEDSLPSRTDSKTDEVLVGSRHDASWKVFRTREKLRTLNKILVCRNRPRTNMTPAQNRSQKRKIAQHKCDILAIVH